MLGVAVLATSDTETLEAVDVGHRAAVANVAITRSKVVIFSRDDGNESSKGKEDGKELHGVGVVRRVCLNLGM